MYVNKKRAWLLVEPVLSSCDLEYAVTDWAAVGGENSSSCIQFNIGRACTCNSNTQTRIVGTLNNDDATWKVIKTYAWQSGLGCYKVAKAAARDRIANSNAVIPRAIIAWFSKVHGYGIGAASNGHGEAAIGRAGVI